MHRASLNHTYRLVWSDVKNAFVAVAENLKGRGKSSRSGPALGALTLAAVGAILAGASGISGAQTLPTGGNVVSGHAGIASSGNTLTVTQTTARMAADWQSFSIGRGNTVNFVQPSATSVALNRVLGSDVSVIQGALHANGQVFLINPNGVLFTPTAQVNVGGIVASTLSMSTADFMAGNYKLEGASSNAIVNQGRITASGDGSSGGKGGTVALIAAKITNTGTLTANQGHVLLGAGSKVTLDLGGPVKLQVTQGALEALIEQGGAIKADGGLVYLTAKAAGELATTVINHTGITEARSLSANSSGEIILESGHAIVQTGTLNASGVVGGQVTLKTHNLIDAGTTLANGQRQGGSIRIDATGRVLQTTAAALQADGGLGVGGNIRLQAGESAWLSGSMQVTGDSGGDISLTAPSLTLAETQLNASGDMAGGRIRAGGGWQGNDTDLANAQRTRVLAARFDVSANKKGNGGTAVVWSEDATLFLGHIAAKGGAAGGNGGLVEISSHNQLNFGGTVDTHAPMGSNGNLLLDPKNIEIVASVADYNLLALQDPASAANRSFGGTSGIELKNNGVATNRYVLTDAQDSTVASRAGAVYLYNLQTGALISTLTGSAANDQVGGYGATALSNGNFVVLSSNWANGAIASAGAVTWGNGSTGTSGVVSASNSLVGSTASDAVGGYAVTALSNGNYVVTSERWDNAGVVNAGAVTWGNGLGGTVGVVSASNSVVGSRASDQVGIGGITALSNGNYVVRSQFWSNGGVDGAGAVTWGNGSTGTSGVVSASNSLVGSRADDRVGAGGITALNNGNYVVSSSGWSDASFAGVGAVTWGNGSTGTIGALSVANSLVGSQFRDNVGYRVTALSNGHYVVASEYWNNGGVVDAGAVTWGNGTGGTVGVVSASNSLVGSTANDSVGKDGVTALSNGNYVARSYFWANGSVLKAGAVTWGNGSTAGSRTTGAVSAANSLVGSTTNDMVGISGVTALSNGHYVVNSEYWGNGSVVNAGAVTWGNGSTGTSGVVSASNSMVGSATNDFVGLGGVTALSNGNYVFATSQWDNAGLVDAGAVTWANGLGGTVGVLSASNSLVGSTAYDYVGQGGVTALSNGNYVVGSYYWANGSALKAGAVTWGNGSTGTSGAVTAANSLVGSSADDQVGSSLHFGSSIKALSNGNYVVGSGNWANGSIANAGAVTWGNGLGGTVGVVSATNSLVGSTASDQLGALLGSVHSVTVLANGNYVVASKNWDNGSLANAGAVTWGNGLGGTVGIVSATNSLIGTTANDQIGSGLKTALSDGRFVVGSPAWDAVGAVNAGRLDVMSGTGTSFPLNFSSTPGESNLLQASTLLAILNAGTSVTLQANNDITLSTALSVNNSAGNGGHLTLQAGRSILLNANATTDNGNLTLIANDTAAYGVVNAYRDTGAAHITQAAGTSINAGTGTVSINLRNGAGNTHNTAGAITLASITAADLLLQSENFNASITGANKTYDGQLAATLSAVNLTGLGFQTLSNLNLVNPAIGSFSNANAGTGKTVTSTTFRVSGYNMGLASHLMKAGNPLTASASANIDQRPLTVTADDKNKIYGAVNPALTYTVAADGVGSSRGLVNSDTLSGNLRTSASTSSGVGSYDIDASGLVNGNYRISANNGILTIVQPPLTPPPFAPPPLTPTADAAAPSKNAAITFLQYWASAFPLYFQRPQVWSTADIFRTSCSWISCRLGQVSGGIKSPQMPPSSKFQPPSTPGKR
jgi:filamentous hemagglutinin family protein